MKVNIGISSKNSEILANKCRNNYKNKRFLSLNDSYLEKNDYFCSNKTTKIK